MIGPILADASIRIGELEKNPSAAVAAAEDVELARLVCERASEEPIEVGLDEL
jgi:hypothetical protein